MNDTVRDWIAREVAKAPPLTPEQKARLVAIVNGVRPQTRPDPENLPDDLHCHPEKGQK